MRISKTKLRQIIREELIREFGGKQRTPAFEEEMWTASVRSGERRGKMDRYSGQVQDDIEDAETYLDDVGMGVPGDEEGAYMYGSHDATGHSDEDLIYMLDPDEDELQPGEAWDAGKYYEEDEY